MQGLGEEGIDLSFEDLDFIDEVVDGQEGEINEENTADPNESKGEGETAAESKDDEKEAEKTAENIDDTTEGENPDAVSGSAADGDGEQTSPQLYQLLADTLHEKGVLTSADESSLKDIKNIDQFVEVMKEQIKAQELNDLTETQRTALKGIREGASDDTVTRFQTAMSKLDKIDDTMISDNVKVRQDLIYQDFLSKGFTPEKAALQVDRSIKLGVDLEDAKDAYTSLKTVVKERYDQAKAAEITKADEDAKGIDADKEHLKKTMLKKEEVIKGFTIPEATRKEVYKEMMDNVSVNPTTKKPENSLMKYQRENPEEFTHKLYYLWKLSEGFTDLSYFGGKKRSSSVKNLENAIKNSTHIQGGGDPSYSDDINTGLLDIEDIVLPE